MLLSAETNLRGDMPRNRLVWYVDTFSCKSECDDRNSYNPGLGDDKYAVDGVVDGHMLRHQRRHARRRTVEAVEGRTAHRDKPVRQELLRDGLGVLLADHRRERR